MTVTASSTDYAGPYAPDGIATAFPFSFKVMSEEEVKVLRLAADGTENVLSGYDVTLADVGGTVTISPALAIGDPLYIVSDPSYDQQLRFEGQGAWSPSSLDEGLDRAAVRDIALASAIQRAPLAPPTEQLANLPVAASRAGKYFAFDANGNPVMSSGTGNDSALRTDIATSTGGSLIGLLDGTALSGNIFRARRLFYGTRTPVTTLRQARLLAATIHNSVVGYAKTAGITGGYGKTEFIVTIGNMDPTLGSYSEGVGVGSLAWCMAQAGIAGGIIIIHPTLGHQNLIVRDNILNRINTGQNDITIIAPGRNLTLWHSSLTGSSVIKGHNLILYGVDYRTLPGPMSGDYNGDGTKVEVGLVSVFPQNIDKLAFISCTFNRASDGACDIAATGFTTASSAAYVTFQNCLFRDTDEVSLFGSISDTTVVADTRKLFVTVYNCVYDGCGQRQPKALGLAMVDVVSCYFQMQPWRRDEPSPASEYGSCHGVSVQDGGWALVRGCLFTALDGVSGHEATKLVANPTSGETGRIRHVSNAAENAMVYATDSNSSLVPDPPYIADLPTVPVPAIGTSREAWIADRWLAAGAGVDAAPEGLFTWEPASTEYPNQNTVVRRRVGGSLITGREIRIDAQAEIPLDPGPTDSDTIDSIPRGYTRTVGFTEAKTSLAAIGPTFLDLLGGDSSYFAVQGNAAPATLKHVVYTDGTVVEDGLTLEMFGSSSAPVTIKSSTSATVTATAATDVIAHSSHGETVSGFQVVFSNSGGALPAGLVSGTVYYGIYVDANSYKVATSYANALASTAVDITDTGTGTHTATLGSFNLPGSADIVLDSSAKVVKFRLNTGNNRFNAYSQFPLTASVIKDWASLASGATPVSQTVTVTGAAVGDFARATMSVSLQGMQMWASVTAADTVTVYLKNDTGGTIDLASATLKVMVTKG